MNKRCPGCGSELQTATNNNPGYVSNINNSLCDRCYRLKHFNQQYDPTLTNDEYIKVVKTVIEPYNRIIVVIDACNLHASLNQQLLDVIGKREVMLLVNKIDILPRVIRPIKIINWIEENIELNFFDIILTSAQKKYNVDEILYSLREEKISEIPIIGMTNVGKTSIINSLLKSVYPDEKFDALISPYSGTTLDAIKLHLDDIILIDTPGIVNSGNIQNYLTKKSLNRVYPKKEYKQQVYQINPNNSLLISSVFNVDYIDGSKLAVSVYMSEQIQIHRCKTDNKQSLLDKHLFTQFLTLPLKNEANKFGNFITREIILKPKHMLMVDGLCFMTFNNKQPITIQVSCLSPISWAVVPSFFKE